MLARKASWFGVIIALIFGPLAFGQITFETVMSSNGIGGVGAFNSSSKTRIDGDKKRSESQFQFTGAIMKHFSPKGTNIDITRLDKELMWSFNDKDKEYTQITFAQMKQQIEEAMKSMGSVDPSAEQEKEKRDQEYEWSKPELLVKKLGDKQNINGFPSEHYLITLTTIGKHKATGIMDTLLFSSNSWNSTAVLNDMQAVTAFELRFAEKLGFDKPENMGMMQLLNLYGEEIRSLQKQVSKVEGYPVRMIFTGSMTTYAYAKSGNQTEAVEGSKTDVTDVKGALGGFLGKKIKQAATKGGAEKSKSAKKELFQMTNELKSLSSGGLGEELFNVPAGYKLKS